MIALLAEVSDPRLLFEPILDEDTSEPTGLFIDGPLYKLFKNEFADEPVWLSYMEENHLYNKWSRAWGPPGEVRDTNTLERFNLELKGQQHLNSVDGAVTLIENLTVAGGRISRAQSPLAQVCPV